MEAGLRSSDKVLLVENVAKQVLHAGDWVTNRHSAKSIAVVSICKG